MKIDRKVYPGSLAVVKVVTPEVQERDEVTLTLTPDEAGVLFTIVSHVGGPYSGDRKVAAQIHTGLSSCGIFSRGHLALSQSRPGEIYLE